MAGGYNSPHVQEAALARLKALLPMPDETDDRPRGRRPAEPGVRHCWVVDAPGLPGRRPGLLLRWEHEVRGERGWAAEVVVPRARGADGRVSVEVHWLSAEYLRPA